jgi:hypothetical protein
MSWLCLKDNALSGSQMCIVTGPRIDLAIALIDRMKKLFAGKHLNTFDTKEIVIELNNVKIEAIPSHHLDAMRGLSNVSFILLDDIRSLKLQIGEDPDYDKVIARYRSEGLDDSWSANMRIVPVNFNSEHKAMLGHCKMILEHDRGRIAINPDKFDKLITALRTAVDNSIIFILYDSYCNTLRPSYPNNTLNY